MFVCRFEGCLKIGYYGKGSEHSDRLQQCAEKYFLYKGMIGADEIFKQKNSRENIHPKEKTVIFARKRRNSSVGRALHS